MYNFQCKVYCTVNICSVMPSVVSDSESESQPSKSKSGVALENGIFSPKWVTFDLELWPITFIVLWEYLLIYVNPSYQISLPLKIPSQSYGWKMQFLGEVQWPLTFGQFVKKSNQLIYTSCIIIWPGKKKIHLRFFLLLSIVVTRSGAYWWTDRQPKNIMPLVYTLGQIGIKLQF